MTCPLVMQWVVGITGFEPGLVSGRAVQELIERRMRAVGGDDERAYLERLRSDERELELIADAVAVPETSLFRYAESFELLRRRLAERRAADRVVRMASLGCATGEEPCSMAAAAVAAGWPADGVVIDAFDRSDRALGIARGGSYAAAALERVPEWGRRCFTSSGACLQVRQEILRTIRYRRADVLRLPPPEPPGYDVIFCRNVLIYLGAEARGRLIDWIIRALVPDGLLFGGHAEHGPLLARGALSSVDGPRCFAFTPRSAAAAAPRVPPAVRVAPRRGPPVSAPVRSTPPAPAAAPRAIRPTPAAPSLASARALADRGDLRPALAMVRAVVEQDGPSADALELLGTVHLALEDVDRAHECFFRAVYLDPDHEPALLQLALLCSRLGDPVQSARYRRRARRAHDSRAGETTR